MSCSATRHQGAIETFQFCEDFRKSKLKLSGFLSYFSVVCRSNVSTDPEHVSLPVTCGAQRTKEEDVKTWTDLDSWSNSSGCLQRGGVSAAVRNVQLQQFIQHVLQLRLTTVKRGCNGADGGEVLLQRPVTN